MAAYGRNQAVGERRSVFKRILVGVDETQSSLEACRHAVRLLEPGGRLEALFALDVPESRIDEELELVAKEALRKAGILMGRAGTTQLVRGWPRESLLRELARKPATLVAVGTHGHRRMTEILIGGTAGFLLHEAPCSVLVARPPLDALRFPDSVVAGIDGSPEADAALAVARSLADRFEASLRVVVSLAGKGVDLARVKRTAPLAEEANESPVDALVRAANTADLVVVGSRGLHGMRALGSISERVAFEASHSVLVVRRHPKAATAQTADPVGPRP